MKYFLIFLAVIQMVSVKLPAALADGKLTIEEMADLLGGLLKAVGIDIVIDVPMGLKHDTIGVKSDFK